MRIRQVLLALLLSGAAGCVSANWSGPADFYAYVEAAMPVARTVSVCSSYSCRHRTEITFSDADLDRIRSLFADVVSPAGERAAMAGAIALIERMVGKRAGTARDRGLLHTAGSGDPGQLDCIDETANTTSYLLVMERARLLRHHSVRKPALRGALIDGRWPHFTAVVTEQATGVDYAVDSWVHDNGERPVVMRLDRWLMEW
ncbi:MAG TPA: hypothetical protein VFJ13_11920 [Paracoccaceae bacterium]|nr:hypothetical protein [Paracoccaceae bacterium]